jgi:hypothetical protein
VRVLYGHVLEPAFRMQAEDAPTEHEAHAQAVIAASGIENVLSERVEEEVATTRKDV